MKKEDINNWKLIEVLDDIELIEEDARDFLPCILNKLNVPTTKHTTTNREFTEIDWGKMKSYFKFFFDNEGEEKINEEAFKSSELSKKKSVIIFYDWNVPVVKVPVDLFIKDWEDFIASTQWETIMFSEDYELIMEVSRDYNLYSNFKIR